MVRLVGRSSTDRGQGIYPPSYRRGRGRSKHTEISPTYFLIITKSTSFLVSSEFSYWYNAYLVAVFFDGMLVTVCYNGKVAALQFACTFHN